MRFLVYFLHPLKAFDASPRALRQSEIERKKGRMVMASDPTVWENPVLR